jgi:glycosyltransferase involved in cell wall biosynthesis
MKPRLDGLLILSYFFPPMSNGPAFVMESLLAQLDVRGSTVYCGRPGRYSDHLDRPSRVDTTVRQFDLPPGLSLADGRLRLGAAANVLLSLALAVSAARTLRRPEIRGLLVVYPKQHFLLAALLAALTTRKPLAVYFMDVYVEGLPRGRTIARLIERWVARRASVVFAMSEPHAEHLARKFPRARVVELPHPCEEDHVLPERRLPGTPSIVFTGAVYEAQADAIRRLVAALDLLPDLDPQLHLFSQTAADDLQREGIRPGKRVHIQQATRSESRAAQRAADVLFLPLAFEARRDVVVTASPSKLPEYLAAGRPILVHAPPTAYVVAYARERGFAEVVDVPDADALARAVERLAADEDLRRRLISAGAQTLEEHRVERVAETLRTSLERLVAAPTP